ncbi:BnaC09g51150D [Brassica napus]|uniref:BnaC09g51150D protein n=1 Tax=Brassica napus TaxID=3708 RepID=A0A078INR4_BRANA|nr:BnaC09g51150D [Brassica napus]
MLLSMAMMVTTPPSCIQPPPDQPPSSPSRRYSPPDVTLLTPLLRSPCSLPGRISPRRRRFLYTSSRPCCVSSWC